MKDCLLFSEEKGLWLMSESQNGQTNYAIIKKSDITESDRNFKFWNYYSNKMGEIIDEKTKLIRKETGEVIVLSDLLVEDDAKFIFNILKSGIEIKGSLISVLNELDQLFNRVKLDNDNFCQGLFGELVLIKEAANLNYNLAKDFRDKPYDLYDFEMKLKNRFIEVKTTSQRNSNVFVIHGKQINKDKEIFFANFKVEQNSKGQSCWDLYKEFKHSFDLNSWIHDFFKDNSALLKGLKERKFIFTDLSIYNAKQIENQFVILSPLVGNYSYELNFSTLEKENIENLLKEV